MRGWVRACAVGSIWMLAAGCVAEVGVGESEGDPLFVVPGDLQLEGTLSVDQEGASWQVPIQLIGGRWVSGGDMVLGGMDLASADADERLTMAAGIKSSLHKWPKGIVRYKFHGSMGVTARTMARAVMDELQSKTKRGVLFRTKQVDTKDWVLIKRDEPGCWSHLGRTGGKQLVNLGNGCRAKSVIRHELGHTLGLIHEHQRMMRDNYIRVLWSNIAAAKRSQFRKWNKTYSGTSYASTGLSSYNVQSIMHYSSWAFAKSGKRSLRKLNGDSVAYNSTYSTRDIEGLKTYYPPR